MKKETPYKFTKLGTALYWLCINWTTFLVKHKWLYYVLALTWGLLLTVVGWIITLVLLICGCPITPYYWVYYQCAGPDYWGGFEMGLMFVKDKRSQSQHLKNHEWGHTFQNCLFGPLMIFIVSGPSCIRYWYQEFRSRKGKANVPYDSIWFEAAATDCGNLAVEYLKNKKG